MRVSHQKLREKPWRAKSPCAYPRAVQSATRTSPRNGVLCEGLLAGRVAARPGKAGDQTKLDRVLREAEDDRNRRGGSFGRAGTIAKPGVVITATRRRTSSAMSADRRSYWPSSQWCDLSAVFSRTDFARNWLGIFAIATFIFHLYVLFSFDVAISKFREGLDWIYRTYFTGAEQTNLKLRELRPSVDRVTLGLGLVSFLGCLMTLIYMWSVR